MTQTFYSDANGDLAIGGNQSLTILSGADAVAAACKTACLSQLGEMVLAQQRGLPNYQALWDGQPNLPVYREYLAKTLLAIDGVTGVQSIELKINGGTVSYTATITTQYGSAVING